MDKEVIEVPVMSAKVRAWPAVLDGGAGQGLRVHLGDAAGGHGDRRDGARRHRDADRGVAQGAETLPGSGRHLTGQGGDGAHLRRQFRLLQRHQPGLCEIFRHRPAGAELCASGVVADGV